MHNAILIYGILCLIVGYLGRRTRLGFMRSALLSFLLTPMVIFVYLLLFASLPAGSEKDSGL
jgi:hypothetical protein